MNVTTLRCINRLRTLMPGRCAALSRTGLDSSVGLSKYAGGKTTQMQSRTKKEFVNFIWSLKPEAQEEARSAKKNKKLQPASSLHTPPEASFQVLPRTFSKQGTAKRTAPGQRRNHDVCRVRQPRHRQYFVDPHLSDHPSFFIVFQTKKRKACHLVVFLFSPNRRLITSSKTSAGISSTRCFFFFSPFSRFFTLTRTSPCKTKS